MGTQFTTSRSGIFAAPKPKRLIRRVIEIAAHPGDIALAVAHKMGKQYIGIEQMDYIETIPVERLKRVIAG